MNLQNVRDIKNDGNSPIPIRSASRFRRKLVVNHKIAIPVQECATYYDTQLDIAINDEFGNEIAILCFTKEIQNKTWHQLTDNQFIAFLSEASFADIDFEYKFNYNYLIVNDNFYDNYLKNYFDTAPIWGGFFHLLPTPMLNHKNNVPVILLKKIDLKNKLFLETSIRSVLQPFAFERYLKLYHLLELRFDSEVIEQIKGLDIETNSEKIGEILNMYNSNRSELNRLQYIIDISLLDINKIIVLVNEISAFKAIATKMFYLFGKDANPLKNEDHFEMACNSNFTMVSLQQIGIRGIDNNGQYIKFIKKLVCYWIYRMRSSTAHSRIGEFILSYEDEKFIAEFGEPLIKEVVIQCFKC